MSARLKEMYQNEMVDAMIKKFGYKNIMEVPKLDKIVVIWVLAKLRKMRSCLILL